MEHIPDACREILAQLARAQAGGGGDVLVLRGERGSMSDDKLKEIAGHVAEIRAALQQAYDLGRAERDKEWAAALDPLNIGTDYGAFLADPERATLLILGGQELAVSQAVAERDRKWVQACLFPKPPSADLTPEGAIALVLAEERKALRARIVALSLSHWPNDVRPYRDDILAALDARASQDPSPGNAASRNISDGVPGVAPESPAVDWMKRMEKS